MGKKLSVKITMATLNESALKVSLSSSSDAFNLLMLLTKALIMLVIYEIWEMHLLETKV